MGMRGDCGGRDAGMRRGLWGKGCRDEEGTVREGMQG